MAEVKWIKITTDIFNDEKMLLIESLPEADSIIVIWFKLLCLAGKTNNSGVFMMGNIAYTDSMLATIFRRKEATVQLALKTFEQFGMIEIINGVITLPNWGKHQNLEQIQARKEYQREYQREYRKKQELLMSTEGKCLRKHLHKQNINRPEEDKDKEDKDNKVFDTNVSHTFCPEATAPGSEAVIKIPLNDGTTHNVTLADVERYSELYQGISVMTELRKMVGWCEANPQNRKTKRGVHRFINSWLSRAQDKAPRVKGEKEAAGNHESQSSAKLW